jgi:hypothetical protein
MVRAVTADANIKAIGRATNINAALLSDGTSIIMMRALTETAIMMRSVYTAIFPPRSLLETPPHPDPLLARAYGIQQNHYVAKPALMGRRSQR